MVIIQYIGKETIKSIVERFRGTVYPVMGGHIIEGLTDHQIRMLKATDIYFTVLISGNVLVTDSDIYFL